MEIHAASAGHERIPYEVLVLQRTREIRQGERIGERKWGELDAHGILPPIASNSVGSSAPRP